jgi:geranylgeranyl pyrophosphate synthase
VQASGISGIRVTTVDATRLVSAWVQQGMPVSPLSVPSSRLLEGGGKRLRPGLLLAAARAGTEPEAGAVNEAALAVELFHCASLSHDDVIDDAVVRRNRVSVGYEFGTTTAALVGGWLFGHGASIIARCGETAIRRYSEAASCVCSGQTVEICDLYDLDRTEARYFEAVEGKTASLFQLCTLLGAELASADAATVETAGIVGWEFGMSFQLMDDVNDLLEDESASGKKMGKDLLQGVYTLPVIYAIEDAPPLRDLLSADLDPAMLPVIAGEIRATTGPTRTIELARAHAESATSAALDMPGGRILADMLEEHLMRPLESLL